MSNLPTIPFWCHCHSGDLELLLNLFCQLDKRALHLRCNKQCCLNVNISSVLNQSTYSSGIQLKFQDTCLNSGWKDETFEKTRQIAEAGQVGSDCHHRLNALRARCLQNLSQLFILVCLRSGEVGQHRETSCTVNRLTNINVERRRRERTRTSKEERRVKVSAMGKTDPWAAAELRGTFVIEWDFLYLKPCLSKC